MEIQSRQLIDDDAHRNVLALSCIHSCHKAVENQGIQRTNDALHLGVVGNEQIARILRVADLQVEVIAVLMEYPITLLGGKAGGIDTQRAYHSLQLLHGFVGKGGLERTKQRGYLIVSLQHLEDGLITLIEERQNMRHIRVFAQPIGGLHLHARMIEHPSCGYQPLGLRVFTSFGYQHLPVLVVGLFAIVAEEIDAGGKEVDGRGLEELVAATAAFLLSLLQGFKQSLGGLARCGKVVDVLQLNRVHTTSTKFMMLNFMPLGILLSLAFLFFK